MQIVIFIWTLFFADLSTTVDRFEGTIKECQKQAMHVNEHSKEKMMGCIFQLQRSNPRHRSEGSNGD